jgi:hypothetical protein
MCLSLIRHQGCRGMCLTRFAHLDLKFPFFLLQYACCDFLSQYAYCNVQYACSIYCDAIDNFLLNKKGLVLLSILPKKSCNMHIARRNMHIATASILRLTHTWYRRYIILYTLHTLKSEFVIVLGTIRRSTMVVQLQQTRRAQSD